MSMFLRSGLSVSARGINIGGGSIKAFHRFIKSLGPPVFFYPLSIAAAAFIAAAQYGTDNIAAWPGAVAVGLMFFIHSLTLVQKKRIMENYPTSKIGTMPMGGVEINGKAVQKFPMKAPFTKTACVYYYYEIRRRERTAKGGTRDVIEACGESEDVPFYVDDGTGRVTVTPAGAEITASQKTTLSYDSSTGIAAIASFTSSTGRFVCETIIPEGKDIYVLGHAERLVLSSDEKEKALKASLALLRANAAELRKYDVDGDGNISDAEWNAARTDAEGKFLEEILKKGDDGKNDIAVMKPPSGGPFYIADKSEASIISSLKWRIPLFLLIGIAGTGASSFYTYKFTASGAIPAAVKAIFQY